MSPVPREFRLRKTSWHSTRTATTRTRRPSVRHDQDLKSPAVQVPESEKNEPPVTTPKREKLCSSDEMKLQETILQDLQAYGIV